MGAPDVSKKRRLFNLFIIIAILFVALLGRLFYVQVVWGPELQEKALTQWTMDASLSAERGKVLDRDGQTLAQSGTAYTIELNPQQIADNDQIRVATELSQILNMDFEYIYERINPSTGTKKKQVILKRQVERETVDKILSCRLGRGVTFGIDTKRYYPMGSLLSQTLGFCTVDGIGQEGLEKRYDKYLAGEAGRIITETDRDNKPLAYGAQEFIEPVNGSTVVLTVDSVVQSFLEKALQEALEVNKASSAQGIIMDATTGEILAISTKPDYDPNAPPREDIQLLQDLVKNRIVCDAYEPGSTFKVVTLSAAVDSGAVSLSDTYDCPGHKNVNGENIKCWRSAGHGSGQDIYKAAQNSCNPAFMTMALKMGKETFYDYIYKFGFGSSTESGLNGESGGIVIHEKYVRENNIARIGFGQSIAVTPIQLVSAVSAAVNGGNLMQPHIVKQIIGFDGSVVQETEPTAVRRVISEESSKTVRSILESVVSEGSGKNAQIPGYKVGGKTGTAQKYVDGAVSSGSLIASFIGFAPADDPKYVCLILVDEPQVGVIFGSTVAAPFVKDVLQETLMHYGVKPTEKAQTVTVPDVRGKTAAEAAAILKEAGLEADYVDAEAEAQVVAQVPSAKEIMGKDGRVLLYTTMTSRESVDTTQEQQGTVVVPDLSGKTRLEAYKALHELGLTLRINPEDQSGVAVRQIPSAGATLRVGDEVTVEFSQV
ncbi:PASTA domain-containing protein [Christensenellaceae bacterium OttesenSCG-928-M15]|nr:PASTA domain-containing protein [Christensenellaceae bacterium OttesenSCG-928-M15]